MGIERGWVTMADDPCIPCDLTSAPDQVMARLTTLLAVAQKQWGRVFPLPVVTYDLRGRSAGQARCRDNRIRINRVLMTENLDHFVQQTVGHELAHLVCWHVHGMRVRAHGPEWRQIMGVFGLPADSCHSYDTARSAARKPLQTFPYRCRCRVRQMTIIRHRRMIKAPGYYKCTVCKEILRPST